MFVLASRSPQRKDILEKLGVEFTIVPPPFDESLVTETDPIKRAIALAEGKAASVANDHPDQWVIGCDTLVVSEDGQLLEKPLNEEDARRMLALHSGKTSTIHSSLCLQKGNEKHTDVSTARVTFKSFSPALVEWWLSTDLWRDRSGAFQIDGEGEKLVEKLEGEFETVVGFPVQLFKMSAGRLGGVQKI